LVFIEQIMRNINTLGGCQLNICFRVDGLYTNTTAHTLNSIDHYTGRFIILSLITNIYNKKTPNAYAEPSMLLFSTSIAP
jgi:hypothetical protein